MIVGKRTPAWGALGAGVELGWSNANPPPPPADTFSQVPLPTHPGLQPARRNYVFCLQGKLCFPLRVI